MSTDRCIRAQYLLSTYTVLKIALAQAKNNVGFLTSTLFSHSYLRHYGKFAKSWRVYIS